MESRPPRRWLLLAVTFGCLAAAAAGAREEYSEEGARACLDCHETPYVMGILDTVHAETTDPKTPAAQKQCQSCHGPSAVHMNFPMQVANVHFGKQSGADPKVQNQMCMECHADGERADWGGSAHGFEDVVCSTCHSAHDPKKIVPAEATVSTGCTEECHQDLMAGQQPSDFSHAIGAHVEGNGKNVLTCDGCHNPHGPLDSGRCTECHEQTPEVLSKESEKARRFHKVAEMKGTTCMRCHKAIAHPLPPLVLQQTALEMQKIMGE